MRQNIFAKFESVSKRFASEQILTNISFDIAEGEIVTLIGPNGSGKTTLVRILLGIISPDEGHVDVRKGLSISYVPQKVNIDPSLPLTVDFFLKHGRQKLDVSYFEQLVVDLKVKKIIKHPIQDISGGELQRVLLLRALLLKPQLLILDEPAQGVDVTGQDELYRLISKIRTKYHCSILMVSHDLHLVMASTDKVVCLNHHICCSGKPSDVSNHPEYLKLFGDYAQSELALYKHTHDHQHDTHGKIVKDI